MTLSTIQIVKFALMSRVGSSLLMNNPASMIMDDDKKGPKVSTTKRTA